MNGDLGGEIGRFEIVHRREPFVGATEDEELRSLLALCFTGPDDDVFLKRRYYLEPPEERWMVRGPSGPIAAHIALRERVVRIGALHLPVGGVSEVCVHPLQRGRGWVKELLALAHQRLRERSVPHALLFGEEPVYRSSGYRPADNVFRYWHPVKFRWIQDTVANALACELSDKPWPAEMVDLRGILY